MPPGEPSAPGPPYAERRKEKFTIKANDINLIHHTVIKESTHYIVFVALAFLSFTHSQKYMWNLSNEHLMNYCFVDNPILTFSISKYTTNVYQYAYSYKM